MNARLVIGLAGAAIVTGLIVTALQGGGQPATTDDRPCYALTREGDIAGHCSAPPRSTPLPLLGLDGNIVE